MNQVISSTITRLKPALSALSDVEIVEALSDDESAGDALFYLLYERYRPMLRKLFGGSKTSWDFDDFMLELYCKLFDDHCAGLRRFNPKRAKLSTYLYTIARNLLANLAKREEPMLNVPLDQCDLAGTDAHDVMVLMDAINTYPKPDARYVLRKTVEGYKSKEIADMLTSLHHEDGSLAPNETRTEAYVNTLRSRALREIRLSLIAEQADDWKYSAAKRMRKEESRWPDSELMEFKVRRSERTFEPEIPVAAPTPAAEYVGNPFVDGLLSLLREMRAA